MDINSVNLAVQTVERKMKDPSSSIRGELNATYGPKWKATTAYLAGDKVVSPEGIVVTALSAFTSGATYDSTKWRLVSQGLPAYATTTTVPFNAKLSTYNDTPARLRAVRAQLGKVKAGTGEFRFAALGDSTDAGVGATAATSWPSRLAAELSAAGYPTLGSGVIPLNKGDLTIDSRVLPTNGAWAGSGWSAVLPMYSSLMQGSSSAFPIRFAPANTGTVFRLGYFDNAGSGLSITIDGGAAVNVPMPGTGQGYLIHEIAGLANTTHTIDVRSTTGGAAQPVDVELTSAGYGVRSYNAGIAGSQMLDVANSSAFSTSSVVGSKFNPHLVFIASEINGLPAGRTLAQYKADTTNAITRATLSGATCVLLTANPVQGLFSDEYRTYTNALYEVAVEKGVMLIDIQAAWDYGSFAGAGLMSDSAHPNASGYAVLARTIWNALGL